MLKHKKLFLTVTALTLAAVMTASLAGCSGKQTATQDIAPIPDSGASMDAADPDASPAETLPSGGKAAGQSVDGSSSSPKATEETAQGGGKKSGGNALDLEHASFDYVNPFSEGYAWVIHKGKIKVINKAGETIFETDSDSYQTDIPMPFCGGVSCYNVERDYYIIDKEGNTLYQTKPYDENDYEEILACGDGHFLVHRFSKGFRNGEKTGGHYLGTIDPNGNEATGFYPIDFTPQTKWEYLCDGVFYEPLDKKVFDSESGKCSSIGSDVNGIGNETNSVLSWPHSITAENGKVWVELSNLHGLGILDVHTLEIQKFECAGKNDTYIIDNIGVVDGVYYDLNGEKVAEISAYLPNVIRRGKFSEAGCTPLVLQDGSSYITYVDKSGKDQFDPMIIDNNSSFTEDYFANPEGDYVVIYDHTGKEKCRKMVSDKKDLTLYDDYFIAGKNYYFFQ